MINFVQIEYENKEIICPEELFNFLHAELKKSMI